MASFKSVNKKKIYSRFFLADLSVNYEQGEFYVGNETVTHVDLIGTVVSLSNRGDVKLFEIEDGTGKIRCSQFLQEECRNHEELKELLKLHSTDTDHVGISSLDHSENLQLQEPVNRQKKNLDNLSRRLVSVLASHRYQLQPLQLGDLVNISGRLNIYRSASQIIVNQYRHIQDINEVWYRVLEIEKLNVVLDRRVELQRCMDRLDSVKVFEN